MQQLVVISGSIWHLVNTISVAILDAQSPRNRWLFYFSQRYLRVVHNYQHLLKRTESTLGGGGLGSLYAFFLKIKILFFITDIVLLNLTHV